MSEKLKPCPFCGRKGKIVLTVRMSDGSSTDAAVCSNKKCHARPIVRGGSAAEAIRLWNTRKDASHE